MNSRIYLPATAPDQWAAFLAEPGKHWRTGYSARTLAYSWQEANGFPREVQAALNDVFPGIELLLGIPEHQVHLPGGSRPSQNDLWALARCDDECISIAVEGKVAESFDKTIEDWLGTDPSPGKHVRLAYLCDALGLQEPIPRTIRYQLLHRTVSALIEARRFGASHAVMLVHSFSPSQDWFEDYAAFAALFRAKAGVGRVVGAGYVDGVNLHLAWVCGDPSYLLK